MKTIFRIVLLVLIQQSPVWCQDARIGLSTAKENNVLSAFEFRGDTFLSGKGGTVLSPLGVIVTGKGGIKAGMKDGKVRLFTGELVEVPHVIEADVELVFLVTSRPLKGKPIAIRKSTTLVEGEELVGRGPIGGHQFMSTVRGYLSRLPDQRSGFAGAQLPLTDGCSGVGLFDLKGSLVGVVHGPQKNAPGFQTIWSCDVIRGKIIECFGTTWDEKLVGVKVTDTKISSLDSQDYGLQVGDVIKSVEGASIDSFTDWLLAGAAVTFRQQAQVSLEVERNGSLVTLVIR